METVKATRKQGFCLLEISWIRGLFLDFLSFEVNEVYHSLFCMFLSREGSYLEILGFVIVDTTDFDEM